jgi:hypothetical protein
MKNEIEKAIAAIQLKYDIAKKTPVYIHKMLGQTCKEAKERHQGFLSGLLTAIMTLEVQNGKRD